MHSIKPNTTVATASSPPDRLSSCLLPIATKSKPSPLSMRQRTESLIVETPPRRSKLLPPLSNSSHHATSFSNKNTSSHAHRPAGTGGTNFVQPRGCQPGGWPSPPINRRTNNHGRRRQLNRDRTPARHRRPH